ncbi:MAG: tRNA uridine-5-carboxymethylaminomethyl(34) synthesis GTPase MnmE [Myxococcales bacterium]|nr:tRNA uridine-5-carboxymethylaminomethyl(34) synthesis GTPase MnmE [Myxococcales bacterium]
MLPDRRDTIAALATARGRAGVAIVRLSGPDALAIGRKFFRPHTPAHTPPPRQMVLGTVLDGEKQPLDEALFVYFPAKSSYTAEPVVEFHLHGSPVVVETLLAALTAHGGRIAEPGEYTRRAFLGGRLDLSQAEAVAELIEARSLAAARAARRRLTGALSERVGRIRDRLTEALALAEAEIDFPDEDIGPLDRREMLAAIAAADAGVAALLAGHQRARTLAQGAVVALAGRPNAGKSSLFNRLAGARRALVHETAGTTRDPIEAEVVIEGLPLRLVDTAGLRQTEHDVERAGVAWARETIAAADLAIYLIDGAVGVTADDRQWLAEFAAVPRLVVWNKLDLAAPDASFAGLGDLAVSAKEGTNGEELRRRLVQLLGADGADNEALLAAVRHRNLAEKARLNLAAARDLATAGDKSELAALELREAAAALGEIIGETTPDQVLDTIFARFCVGK